MRGTCSADRCAALVLAALLAAAGCAASTQERATSATPAQSTAAAPADDGAASSWISAPPSRDAPPPPRTLAAAGPVLISTSPRAPAPRPAADRPPRRARISVNLKEADLPNALRLLAEAGGFGLVVESDVSGTVTTRLTGVDPYDALLTLAGANGAEAHYERGIVIVRRRGP